MQPNSNAPAGRPISPIGLVAMSLNRKHVVLLVPAPMSITHLAEMLEVAQEKLKTLFFLPDVVAQFGGSKWLKFIDEVNSQDTKRN